MCDCLQLRRIPNLTLPNRQNVPPRRLQGFPLAVITRPTAFELWSPKPKAAFGHAGQPAKWIGVLVPHAAMDKDRDLAGREY